MCNSYIDFSDECYVHNSLPLVLYQFFQNILNYYREGYLSGTESSARSLISLSPLAGTVDRSLTSLLCAPVSSHSVWPAALLWRATLHSFPNRLSNSLRLLKPVALCSLSLARLCCLSKAGQWFHSPEADFHSLMQRASAHVTDFVKAYVL